MHFSGPCEKVLGHDRVGFLNWRVSLCTSGAGPSEALDLINFILKYKLEKGAPRSDPDLQHPYASLAPGGQRCHVDQEVGSRQTNFHDARFHFRLL